MLLAIALEALDDVAAIGLLGAERVVVLLPAVENPIEIHLQIKQRRVNEALELGLRYPAAASGGECTGRRKPAPARGGRGAHAANLDPDPLTRPWTREHQAGPGCERS